jgi:hypothetical protein
MLYQGINPQGSIIQLVTKDGASAMCGAILLKNAFPHALNLYQDDAPARQTPYPWTFGVRHAWYANRGAPRSDEEADYHAYRDHLERALNIPLEEIDIYGEKFVVWKLPPVKYNVLVFYITLLRHPLERNREYPRIYQYMLDNKVDPFGALVGITLGGKNHSYYGPYYNSSGHGVGEIADRIYQNKQNPVEYLRRLCMHKVLEQLPERTHTLGLCWALGKARVGELPAPREYIVEPITRVPAVTQPPPKPKRAGHQGWRKQPRYPDGRFRRMSVAYSEDALHQSYSIFPTAHGY